MSWPGKWDIWSHYIKIHGENYILHSLSPNKSFIHFCFDILSGVLACLSFIFPFSFSPSVFQSIVYSTKHEINTPIFPCTLSTLALSSWLRVKAGYQINTEKKHPCQANTSPPSPSIATTWPVVSTTHWIGSTVRRWRRRNVHRFSSGYQILGVTWFQSKNVIKTAGEGAEESRGA